MPVFLLTFVEGFLGPKLAKFAKPLIYAVGALLLLLAMFAAVKIHDHRVIAASNAKQDAATAKADRAADNHAAEQRRVDDARLTDEAQQFKEAQNGATSDLDRRLAFQRCLRLQQSARRDGKQSPSCGGLGVPAGAGSTH